MEAVRRRGQVVTQPVEEREPQAGWQPMVPYTTVTAPVTVNEEVDDISVRKVIHNEQLSLVEEAHLHTKASITSAASSSYSASDDGSSMVVDMRNELQFHNSVRIRQPGLTDTDVGINLRVGHSTCKVDDDPTDLQIVGELEEPTEKPKGYVTYGSDRDICNLLEEKPAQKGVICNDQILHCEDGVYKEGLQYVVIPGTQSKGAFGEAAMCQDVSTQKTFMLKKVQGKLSKNEIAVPVMFRGNAGIPEVYGVIMEDDNTLIFQEFAGLSLNRLNDSEYSEKLRDPKMVMLLGFQAFVTLDKLHSQGVSHQDVKPENLCLDSQTKTWRLKLIDFGSSQTPEDTVTEGLTNEYLSPESCRKILQVAQGQITKADGRLGPETDVWALALSLLYCLCGYHVMVYVNTGDIMYRSLDPKELQAKRIQCVFQICNLTDADIATKLIRPEWPEALRVLLLNTLRVNPQERWTAKQAAYYIFTNWILKGGSGSMEQKTAVAPGTGFTGLTAPRLGIQTQAVCPQDVSLGVQKGNDNERQAVQCTSPMSAVPPTPLLESSNSTQLPAFVDLLSDGLSKLKLRPYKRRQPRDGPYTASRRCSKVMKK